MKLAKYRVVYDFPTWSVFGEQRSDVFALSASDARTQVEVGACVTRSDTGQRYPARVVRVKPWIRLGMS